MVKLLFLFEMKPGSFFLFTVVYDLLIYSIFGAICFNFMNTSLSSEFFLLLILLLIILIWVLLAITSLAVYIITNNINEMIQKIYFISKLFFFFIGIGFSIYCIFKFFKHKDEDNINLVLLFVLGVFLPFLFYFYYSYRIIVLAYGIKEDGEPGTDIVSEMADSIEKMGERIDRL